MQNKNNNCQNHWRLISKIYNWQADYLFEEEWGTKTDWSRNLSKTPNSRYVIEFIELLITNKILIKNKMIIKQNVEYQTYRLHKDFKKKVRIELIETDEFVQFLDKNVYEMVYHQ